MSAVDLAEARRIADAITAQWADGRPPPGTVGRAAELIPKLCDEIEALRANLAQTQREREAAAQRNNRLREATAAIRRLADAVDARELDEVPCRHHLPHQPHTWVSAPRYDPPPHGTFACPGATA